MAVFRRRMVWAISVLIAAFQSPAAPAAQWQGMACYFSPWWVAYVYLVGLLIFAGTPPSSPRSSAGYWVGKSALTKREICLTSMKAD